MPVSIIIFRIKMIQHVVVGGVITQKCDDWSLFSGLKIVVLTYPPVIILVKPRLGMGMGYFMLFQPKSLACLSVFRQFSGRFCAVAKSSAQTTPCISPIVVPKKIESKLPLFF